jgi:predicted O-methyltransferase YrrM
MVAYDLRHLRQWEPQDLLGPIQDDEALFLYALIRGLRCKRVLEVGGLEGYSADNFLAAVGDEGAVYTVELEEMRSRAPNHKAITKDCALITAHDIDEKPLDLIFYDAHELVPQMDMYYHLQRQGMINDHTIIALHDTNLHPLQVIDFAYPMDDGWVHQRVEREMVNAFVEMGYDAFSLHPPLSRHDKRFPMRHGITVLQRRSFLKT